jgi:hypothetical protein
MTPEGERVTVWSRPVEIDDIATEDIAVLLVLGPTGVFYTAQAGGTSCRHPAEEGALVSVSLPKYGAQDALCRELRERGPTNYDSGIPKESADVLDELFEEFFGPSKMSVDRRRLKVSMESWVFVLVQDRDAVREAVLVWPNSD